MGAQLLAAALPESIQKLIDSSPAARTAFWGIQIVDLATGKTLYELNPDHYFVPASNAKLFSTALALTRLGADFTFQTRVLAQPAPDEHGRIRGSLRLAGGGDPNLSARAIPYRMGPLTGNPLAAIEDLADQIVARGVKRVDGDIIGDDTWYRLATLRRRLEHRRSAVRRRPARFPPSPSPITCLLCPSVPAPMSAMSRRFRCCPPSSSTASRIASARWPPAANGASVSNAFRAAATPSCAARFPCATGGWTC